MRVHVDEWLEIYCPDVRCPERAVIRSATRTVPRWGDRAFHVTTVFDPPIEFNKGDDLGAKIAERERELAGE